MSKNKVYDGMKNDLTQVDVRALFDYDAENGWLIRKRTRAGNPWNKPTGHKPTHKGYGQVKIDGKMYLTHRLIWLWYYGTWPQYFVDHIDRNPMNNRIENLEDKKNEENLHNTGIRKTNTSGFSGVTWINRDKRFQVKIRFGKGRRKHIGYYKTLDDAILAAKKAKIEYHPSSPQAKQYAEELGIVI